MKPLPLIYFVSLYGAGLTVATTPQAQLHASSSQISSELGKALSNNASIILPDDPKWDSVIARACYPRISPGYQATVEVATETDVGTTVAYANQHGIDFLAVAGGHGETTTLNRLQNGIQINLRKLNSVTLNNDSTVTVGGGTLQQELVSQLYSHGRQAVTGLCECVSIIGPLLGSGHSFLQSQHGFSVDNIVSANIVLANGTSTYASSTSNPDLFWALRGAGHNFGIVTSFTLRTFPIPSTYTLYTLTFTKNHIHDLFRLVNKVDFIPSSRDPKFFLNAWLIRPAPDQDPIFSYSVAYEGSASELAPHAAPFLALNPSSVTLTTNITYDQIHKALGFGLESFACGKKTNQAISGVALHRWNIPALYKTYSLFSSLTADKRFVNSGLLLESYGIVAVSSVDAKSTAVPPEERERPILTSAVIHYEGDDEATEREGAEWLKRITDGLYKGVGRGQRHAYVNYANGNETLAEVYGREAWRVDKLKDLKARWDPENRFRWYNPIV